MNFYMYHILLPIRINFFDRVYKYTGKPCIGCPDKKDVGYISERIFRTALGKKFFVKLAN